MEEIWKTIPGYEGYYQVSSMGRVRSMPRYVKCRAGKERLAKGRIRKTVPYGNGGYLSVTLSVGNNFSTHPVHRLVAMTFLPAIPGKTAVNHKDGHKLNNRVENLEWCTFAENTKHGYDMGLIKTPPTRSGKQHFRSKPVIQMDKQGNVIAEFESVNQAALAIDYHVTGILLSCRLPKRHAGGYKWQFKNSDDH
jgi:hypothetical protein